MIVKQLPRQRQLGGRVRALRTRFARRLSLALIDHFKQQARRAGRLLRENPRASAEDLLPADGDTARVVMAVVREAVDSAAQLAEQLVGLVKPAGKQIDLQLEALLARAARQVGHIDDVTRAAIRELLLLSAERGYSTFQIVNGVTGDEFIGLRHTIEELYRNRAETVARTEMASASQHAAHQRYGDAGVTEVDILDGPSCGWTSHDDPDLADGSRRTIQEAEEYEISHPNCQRVSLPVVP